MKTDVVTDKCESVSKSIVKMPYMNYRNLLTIMLGTNYSFFQYHKISIWSQPTIFRSLKGNFSNTFVVKDSVRFTPGVLLNRIRQEIKYTFVWKKNIALLLASLHIHDVHQYQLIVSIQTNIIQVPGCIFSLNCPHSACMKLFRHLISN